MSSLQSLDRALQIIEIISENDEISLTKISEKTNLNKATVHRIITALKDNGYVKQLDNKKYSLTFKMFRFGNRAVQKYDFMSEAKRIITKLAIEIEQVIHFVIQDGSQILYVDKYTPANMNKILPMSKIGKRAPMYCTAAGKAILSEKTEQEVLDIWNQTDIIKYTSRTITSFDTLIQDLKRIKKNGYSTEFEEYKLGVYCIGSTLLNIEGEVEGAISVSIPINDTKGKSYYADKLKKCIQEISKIGD